MCWKPRQSGIRNAADRILLSSLLPLKPCALVFQHAYVGMRPAAPVVVPVGLVLLLQSPSAAARQGHAAAETGADRALVLENTDLQLRRRKSRLNTHAD